jgi:hypothetical protein
MWQAVGHDLGRLLKPAAEDAETLLSDAELRSGLRGDGRGGLVALDPEEWRGRWNTLFGARPPGWPASWAGTPAADEPAVLLDDPLAGKPAPKVGRVATARLIDPTPDADSPEGVVLTTESRLAYAVERFPGRDFTLSFWLRVPTLKGVPRLTLLSCHPDERFDPVRLEIEGGCLWARSGINHHWRSGNVGLPEGRWCHVAVVKAGGTLTVALDGRPRASVSVPGTLIVDVEELALEPRPEQPWNGKVEAAAVRLEGRALWPQELRERAARKIIP